MDHNPLHRLLQPDSVATVGAGNNPMKMGTLQALSIIKDGFPGKFFPVHPNQETVLGHPAYPSVYQLPETPDLAMLVVPPDQVISLMEAFGKIGTPRAVIISAGFKETGVEGREMEEELLRISREYGIRFLGPNCMGILNSELPLNVTVASMPPRAGKLGMASQSGTYVTQTLAYLRKRGIFFSKAVSVGNEGDLEITDALEYLGEDPQTEAIALYIEGLRDGQRFLEVARKITPYKPVVAQYVGGTEAGAKAGQSHTGAMSGPDQLMDGLFKQAGILRVHSVEDLYAHGWALANTPPLQGPRVGVVTNSGGPGTAMAHTCNEGGLEVPTFSPSLQQKLRQHLPPHGASGNPVDLTFNLDTGVMTTTIPEILMESGEVDALVLHGAMGHGFRREILPHLQQIMGGISEEEFLGQFSDELSEMLALPHRYGVPLVVSSFFGSEDNYTAAYQDYGIPVIDSPEKTARAMVSLWRYSQVKKREASPLPSLPEKSEEGEKILAAAQKNGQGNLSEHQAKRLLSSYGIPVSPEKLAHSQEEAQSAAEELGYPVVLKGCTPESTHKTEEGLVHLKLQEEGEVREAYRSIQEAAGGNTPVLVSRMVPGEREFMGGMFRFPAFGPVLLFGLGGVFTEALEDTTMRLAPLRISDAHEMFQELRSRKLIDAYRGMPPVDQEALASLLQKLGHLSLQHPEIKEIDLNPIIISGSYPVVVDALMVLEN